MKYVPDASVALKWVLPEADSPQAISLRDAYRQNVHHLIVPDVFAIEFVYALAKVFHRGLLTQSEAAQSLADVLLVSPLAHSSAPLLPRPFEPATQLRISLYDCLYVALAEREQCGLVTADQRLINALVPHFGFVLSLSSLP